MKKLSSAKTIVIFDFDGTIADTMLPMIKIFNKYASKYGYRKVEDEEITTLMDRRPMEILRHLRVSMFKLPLVIRKIRSDLNSQIMQLKPTVDYKQVLTELKQRGCVLVILTSNSRTNVYKFLENNDMNLFDFVYSGRSLFGKAKLLKRIKRKWGTVSRLYYVADEIRDIEAAKSAGIHSVAVSWGFNSVGVLKKEEPNFVATNPEDLVKIITG